MEVITYTKPTGTEKELKYQKPVAKFMLMVANCGVMRCPVDSEGNVGDGIWLNDHEWIKTIDEAKEYAQMSLELDRKSNKSNHSKRSFIDDTLLFENDNAVIWYSQANRLLPQYYTNKVLKPVPHPQLVFFVAKHINRLAVVATNQVARPSLKDKVFHAPLANLYSDQHLCLGTAHLPVKKDSTNIKEMEDCLLASRYSGFKFMSLKLPESVSKSSTSTCETFWESLQGKQTFPIEALLETSKNQTLEQWIDIQFEKIGSSW
ncbi:hypothetical protein ASL83_003345 [Vibrio parahaemolyticus]|nr:hypothetical protein [Vibrio parahaemolyticus]